MAIRRNRHSDCIRIGLVIGVTPGTVTIEAESETVIGEATIVVLTRPIGAVIISPSQATLTVGETAALTVQVTDANGNLLTGRTITYQSVNSSVAQVSADGVVRAIGPGTTEVRASSEGQTGVMSVTVRPTPVASVRVEPATATLSIGDAQQLSASALDAAGNVLPQRTVTWTSGAPSILSVSAGGIVNALAPGTGLIFATIDGRLASATITVRDLAIGSVQVTPPAASLVVGQIVDLTAVVRNASGTVVSRDVEWSSSNPAAAVVSSTGRVRALALGTTQITATVDGVGGAASISVLPIPVASVDVALASTTLNVGQTTQATATLRDEDDNVLTGRAIAWTTSNAAVATVTSTGLVTAVSSGTANIIATSETVAGNASVTVTQVAGTLAMQRQPAGAVSGAPFTTQPIVRILDAQGNLVTSGTGATLAVTAVRESGSATLSGTTTVNAVGGVATFTNLSFGGLGTGNHRLRFTTTSPSLGVNSGLFAVTAGPAATMTAVSELNQTAQVLNLVAEPPSVRITDAGGNPVSGVPVTFAVIAGLGITSPVSGSTVNTGANGVASLTSWRLGVLPGANRVRATAAGLTGSPITFEATGTVGSPAQLAITRQPLGASSGTALVTQPIIEIRDAAGNRVPGATNAVTASVESGGGSVGGTTTVNAVNGVATFTDLRVNGGGTKTLRFSATALTSVVSEAIPVNQSASSLRVQRQPAGASSAIAFTTQPIVEILDAAGLVVTAGTGSSLVVTATLASGSGVLNGTRTATATAGVATFNNLSITGIGPHSLRFATSSPALNVVSESFTLGAGAAAGISALTTTTQTATVLSAVPAPPSVRVTDGTGNPVSGASVTFAVVSGGGSISPAGGAVTTNASGVAALSSWTLGPTAGANSVTATATSGGSSIGTVTFNATGTAGPAASIAAVSSVNQSAPVASAVSAPPSVRVTDANGNAVSGVAVSFTVASGGGSTSPASGSTVNTNASGVATLTSWTLGSTPGANSVNAAVSGLTGSPVLFSATGTIGAPSQLVITTQPSGAVSGAPLTTQPVVQLRDAQNNLVSTATNAVTVTIASGSGSISGTTTVNAVNGVASFGNVTLTGSGPHTLRFATTSPALQVVSSSVAVGAGAAASIDAVTSTSQSATISTAVTAPIVEVTDAVGNPVSGVNVTFTVTAGGGTIAPASGATVATDANGRAALTSWTLGATPGVNSVTATASGLSGSPVVFNATATDAPPTQLAITTQPGGAVSGLALSQQPVVQIRNASNGVVSTSSLAVTATIASGTGTLSGTTTVNAVNGVATFTNLVVSGTGAHTLRFATTSPALQVVSGSFDVVLGASANIAATTSMSQTATVSTTVTAPGVRVRDANNDPVSGVNVTFTLTAGGGSISPASPATVATDANGNASLSSWTLGATPGVNTVTAAVSGLTGSPVTFNATGTAAPPTQLVITAQPAGAVSGAAFTTQPVIELRDAGNAVVTGSSATVTATIESGTGTLGGTTSVNAVNGVATFTNLSITGTGAHTLRFATTTPALDIVSANLDVTAAAPVATNIDANSSTSQSGTVSTTVAAPSVRVSDASNNPVSGVNVTFTLTAGNGSISPASPAVVATNASGIASLTTWTLGATPGTNTVTATAAGLAGSPVTFNATGSAPAATQLAITTQPSGAVSGLALTTQPVIEIRDASNALVSTSSAPVTASIASGTGALVGTQTVNAVNGVATFSNLRIDGAGSHTLQFTSTGLTAATSSAFTATQQAASLQMQTQPAGATSGEAFTTQPVVRILDNAGLIVTTGAGATLSVGASIASGSGTIGGTTSVNAVNGLATFTNLSITGTGAHTIEFETTTPALSIVSASVDVQAAAPVATTIAANSATSQSGTVSTTVTAPSVRVTDAGDNPVSGVNVTFTLTAGNGSISPASPAVVATNASGIASLTTWTLGATPGTNTVTATAAGLAGSPVEFNATGNPAPATQLAITTQPSGAESGEAFTTQPVIELRDASNAVVTGSSATVTASLASGTGALGGTTSVNAVNGVATFTNLFITGSGAHTIEFATTTPALSVVSASFNVNASAPVATNIDANSATSQSGEVSTTVTPPSVRVSDAVDNPVGGVDVTFVTTAGDGSIVPSSPAVVTTNASGIASLTTWTLGATPGTNTVTATASGLAGSPIAFDATGTAPTPPPATQLAVTTQPGGAVSGLALTTQPVVEVRDASNALVSTSSAAVTASITSGNGELEGTVTVNAVNGVATFSNLRIDGSGGHTLQFSSGALAAATSNGFTVSQQAASLSITQQPAGAVSGAAFTTQPIVHILDNAGLLVTTGGGATLDIGVVRATGTATLAGTTTLQATGGIASFSDLAFTGLGTGSHSLQFSTQVPNLSITSNAFNVTAGIAATIAANSTVTQTATTGTDVNTPPSVRVTDANGNPVAGTSVVFTVTSGAGSTDPASGESVVTNASGVATLIRWTLGNVDGENTVSATVSGLAGSPVVFTATGEPPAPSGPPQPAELVVLEQPDRAQPNTVFAQQPLIEIRDATGTRIVTSELEVTASIASGNGTLLGTRTVAAVDGLAAFTDLRIDGRGGHVLRFSTTQPVLSVLSASFPVTPGGGFEFASANRARVWQLANAEH